MKVRHIAAVFVRSQANVEQFLNACETCDYFRDHKRVGARCTHRQCPCGKGTEAVIVNQIRVNAGFVDVIRRGFRCPIAC